MSKLHQQTNNQAAAAAVSAPLYTNKMLFALIIPLIFEQLLNVLVGMADSLMVSSVGEAAVSGISLVDSVNVLLFMVFSALATGGAVICSQFVGKKDRENARFAAKQLVYFSLGVSLVLGAVAILLNRPILRWIFGSIEADVMESAVTYFYISALSFPFLAIYNADAALFRSMNRSRTTLWISIMVNLINISGNALLIYGFRLGVAGAAWATLAARGAGAVVSFVLLCRSHDDIGISDPLRFRLDFKMLKRILKIGVPTGAENSLFQIGKLMLSSLASTFGTAAITGNAIGGIMASISNIPGAAIGLGLVTIVGQCMGAKKPEEAERYTKKMLLWTYVLMNLLNLFLFFGAPLLAGIYHLGPDSTKVAVQILRTFAVFAAVFWPPSFTTPNALRAAGDVRFTMIVSLGSVFVFRVALAYILAYTTDAGIMSVWYGMFADWVVRAIAFTIRFKSGKWKKFKLV